MTPSPSDTCPRCVDPRPVPPYRAEHESGSLRAHYRCPACGWRWWTGYLLTPAEMARYGPDAA